MRHCGPLRIWAGSGPQSSSRTSALPKLRLKWACSPICPLRVCASSSREQSFSLVRCLWRAWPCFVGFFGFGLARCLGFVWVTNKCPYGSGSGIPKLVRRAGNHAPYRPGRIDITRLCVGGQKPRACGRATTCSLGAVHGWSTSSWKSWALRLGGTAGGILCAGLAALRVTLATLS